jgi:hypothetical protein
MSSSRALASRISFLALLFASACTDQQNLGKDDKSGDAAVAEDPSTTRDGGGDEPSDNDGATSPPVNDVRARCRPGRYGRCGHARGSL